MLSEPQRGSPSLSTLEPPTYSSLRSPAVSSTLRSTRNSPKDEQDAGSTMDVSSKSRKESPSEPQGDLTFETPREVVG